MGYFTVRNTTIMALVQVGILVAGVLGAGAVHKVYTSIGLLPPWSTAFLSERGYLALGLPLVWVGLAIVAFRRADDDEFYPLLAVCTGILLLLLFLCGVWYGAARPFLRLFDVCTMDSV